MRNNNNNKNKRLFYTDNNQSDTIEEYEINSRLQKIKKELDNLPELFNGKDCMYCNNQIPSERLKLRTYSCYKCQIQVEQPKIKYYKE